ncbi:MAG TPA: hypothetical protein PLU43_10250, partial [Lachnospiraceae bacterium]|nr:hypothetical protein [Lachnospiraceae bacterium]
QLSVAAGFAKNENYEIPVQIDGEWTSVNLKIIRNSEKSGSVSVTMETEQYGKVAAQFTVENKKVSGYISGDKKESLESLSQKAAELADTMAGEDRTVEEIQFIPVKQLELNEFTKETSDKEVKTSTKELYEVAKAFITVLQKKGESADEN